MKKLDFTPHVTRLYGGGRVEVSERFALDQRARLAIIMIEKWGMVGAESTREDTSGRSVLDLMSVETIVERAFKLTDLAIAEIENREWFQEVTFEKDPVEKKV